MASPGAEEAQARNCSAGNQSRPVKGSDQPEASFASSSEMAARSGNSLCRGRANEPRNSKRLEPSWSYARGNTGGANKARTVWSGRGQRVGQEHTGVPWEHGRSERVLGKAPGEDDTGRTTSRPDGGGLCRDPEGRSTTDARYPGRRKERRKGEALGSLSGLIVARKAGERGARRKGGWMGNRRTSRGRSTFWVSPTTGGEAGKGSG